VSGKPRLSPMQLNFQKFPILNLLLHSFSHFKKMFFFHISMSSVFVYIFVHIYIYIYIYKCIAYIYMPQMNDFSKK